MRHHNYLNFKNSTIEVSKKTKLIFGLWLEKMEMIQNFLLELQYYISTPFYKIPTDEYHHEFYIGILYIYYDLPKTIDDIILLIEKGSYSNALILSRKLLESLVKYKYFVNKKKEYFNCKCLTYKQQKKQKIEYPTIKKTFEDVAGEGSYKKLYNIPSRCVHNNMDQLLFYIGTEKTNILPLFNKMQAGTNINYLIYTIYGYINLIHIFFPRINIFRNSPHFSNKLNELINWFEKIIESNKREFPESNDWAKYMIKIANTK